MADTLEPPKIAGPHHRQGLRTPSPDLTGKASDDTATQVTRIGLTFVGTVAFCLLSLFSPDSALLGGSQKLNVPFAGPVSFFGFMLLGPAVLIVQRIYLQIYVEHSERLDRMTQRMPVVRAPILVPLKNPLIRTFSGFVLTGADLSSGLVIRSEEINGGPVRTNLSRANLSGTDLGGADLSEANLVGANMTDANLTYALNLTQRQLDEACGKDAKLTPSLTLKNKECPRQRN
jgi:hypothetical protein